MSKFGSLRPGDDQAGSERFWSSFADMMTVIVMIFLLTMVMLVIRNWALVERLKHSIAEARAATVAAEMSLKQKAALTARLGAREAQLQKVLAQIRALQSQSPGGGKQAQASSIIEELQKIREEDLDQLRILTRALENSQARLQATKQELRNTNERLQRTDPALVAQGTKKAGDAAVRILGGGGPGGPGGYPVMSSQRMKNVVADLERTFPREFAVKILPPPGAASHNDGAQSWHFSSLIMRSYAY